MNKCAQYNLFLLKNKRLAYWFPGTKPFGPYWSRDYPRNWRLSWLAIIIVERNLWICAIHGSRCAIYGSLLRTGIPSGLGSSSIGQVLQVLVIKYKYFEFSPIKYSSTSSTDTPSTSTSTSTSVNIGWLIRTGNTRAVFPGKYRPVQ